MNLDDQRAELRDVRKDVAERAQELANRLLDARILRGHLEEELRKTGVTKTDAEKLAKLDVSYLTFERETARLEYELEIARADAESRAYGIEAAIQNNGITV